MRAGRWSVEEAARYAARREFEYARLLAGADEGVVRMAERMRGWRGFADKRVGPAGWFPLVDMMLHK